MNDDKYYLRYLMLNNIYLELHLVLLSIFCVPDIVTKPAAIYHTNSDTASLILTISFNLPISFSLPVLNKDFILYITSSKLSGLSSFTSNDGSLYKLLTALLDIRTLISTSLLLMENSPI